MVRNYFCDHHTEDEQIHWPLIAAAMRSVSNLCVVPMQDLLGLDNRARMNTPSTSGQNWKWRISVEDLSNELSEKILKMTRIYGR